MKKQIGTITMGILMLVSAMAMYAGESYSFETNLENPVYTVVGNSSNLEGMNITFESGNITISPVINYKPDNFTLIFFDNLTKIITETVTNNVYHGGGGSSTRYVDKNVTVYKPIYFNRTITETEEVEVEKIVEKTIVKETGYKLWMILLPIVLGGIIFIWFIIKSRRIHTLVD